MKKKTIAILGGLIILGVWILTLQVKYPVKADERNLLVQVEKLLKVSKVNYQTVALEKVITIDNKKYALITIDGYLGNVNLEKGINGRYAITELGYGVEAFRFTLNKQAEGNQLVILGHNFKEQANKMSFVLEEQSYEVQIPSEEYFIVHLPVDLVGEHTVSPYNLKLYDVAENEITKLQQ